VLVPSAVVPSALVPSDLISLKLAPSELIANSPVPASRSPYEAWTLVLGALAILAIISVSFLIGSRIGWLRPTRVASGSHISQPMPVNSAPAEPVESPAKSSATKSAATKSTTAASAQPPAAPTADELVVYEKGKVVFRMKPASTKLAKRHQSPSDGAKQDSDAIVEASSITKVAASQSVWLSPEQAENLLIGRVEPEYPSEALAAHRSGDVVLEVQVAEDGSVSNIRTLSGDPLLAGAAAEAVHNWRYQPYRQHDHPAQFQTDVTLSFSLPN
jgi:TonB family protein